MFRYIRSRLPGATKKQNGRNTARSFRRLRMEGLEVRQMMTASLASTAMQLSGTALPAVVAPAAPSFTATAVSPTKINLSWGSVSGASGYLVDEMVSYGPRSGNGIQPMVVIIEREQLASLGSGSTDYLVTGLSPGTTYSFEVAACNSAGTTWANSQSTTTTTVNQATPTVSWPTPAAITYGKALSGTQLDATASVPGTFSYTPAAGTVLPVGSGEALSVTFTPTDATHYKTVTQTTTIDVNQAPASVATNTTGSLSYSSTSTTVTLSAPSTVFRCLP
jgi:hypothetical protein